MPLKGRRLAFVGYGVMAEAMIRGLLERELAAPSQVLVSGPQEQRGAELAQRYGVRAVTANLEAVRGADVVVLSVKPQVLDTVLAELHGHLDTGQLALSIVAGAPLAKLQQGLGHARLVRAMPNTPAQIGQGMTVWVASPVVTEEERTRAREILGALGDEVEVHEEDYLDMATALSGTGPTYVFLVMEALIDAGVHLGFPRRLAERLVRQTMLGAVNLARSTERHPAELRNAVTSPGGTSAAALYQLEKGSLRTVLSRAVWAAYERSRELGQAHRPGNARPPGDMREERQ